MRFFCSGCRSTGDLVDSYWNILKKTTFFADGSEIEYFHAKSIMNQVGGGDLKGWDPKIPENGAQKALIFVI